MDVKERESAKARLVAGMVCGQSWRAAAQATGLVVARSTAYRWRQRVRTDGEAALGDERHGHPAKLRAPIRAWLVEHCRGIPHASGTDVQAALRERFGLHVSVRQINRVRAALGVGRQAPGAGGKWREFSS